MELKPPAEIIFTADELERLNLLGGLAAAATYSVPAEKQVDAAAVPDTYALAQVAQRLPDLQANLDVADPETIDSETRASLTDILSEITTLTGSTPSVTNS